MVRSQGPSGDAPTCAGWRKQCRERSYVVVASLLLACTATSATAGIELMRLAFSSAGAEAESASYRLGYTVGLPLAGISSAVDREEVVGFWHWGMPTASDVSPAAQQFQTRIAPGFPNPFPTSTEIRFWIGDSEDAAVQTRLEIFDVAGRSVQLLVDEPLRSGVHTRRWNRDDERGRALANGVYFARFEAGTYKKTIRLVAAR